MQRTHPYHPTTSAGPPTGLDLFIACWRIELQDGGLVGCFSRTVGRRQRELDRRHGPPKSRGPVFRALHWYGLLAKSPPPSFRDLY